MKRKKELIVILSSLLVIVLSVSVAYFTTKILGTGKEITVESTDLKVIFTSGSGTINGTNIEPGWTSGENTFTVKNESNGTYKYNIIIKDLVNTFVTEGFLQYKITSTDGGYNMTDFVDVPKSSTATDTTLAENISIEKGATHTYKIIINYNNSDDVDQSADMGKMLSGKIFITKASNPTLASKLLEDNPTISTRSDFSIPFTTNTANTLYKATENGTEVYYFAGVDKMAESHCEYDGNVIWNVDKENKLTESQCVSEITICESEDGIFYGPTIDCENDYSGAETTVSDAEWVETGVSINNWIKFAGFFWKIIRTNADGSIRLLYSGLDADMSNEIGYIAFNTNYNSPKYVGYMYGDSDATLEEARTNTNDSTIKTYIDNWYENNLTSYTNYLSNDAVYCNDRELAGDATYSTSTSLYFLFKTNERLDYDNLGANSNPSYDCTNTKDAFSVNNTEAKLKYPIALMTADEIAYAGGVGKINKSIWYYTNVVYKALISDIGWWTLSANGYSTMSSVLTVAGGQSSYTFDDKPVNEKDAFVRPVLSLKACTLWSQGDGSASNPYEIIENGGC